MAHHYPATNYYEGGLMSCTIYLLWFPSPRHGELYDGPALIKCALSDCSLEGSVFELENQSLEVNLIICIFLLCNCMQ